MENEAGFIYCFRLLIREDQLSPERSQRQFAAIMRRVRDEAAQTGGKHYEQ